jgi:MoxR-like ATPase
MTALTIERPQEARVSSDLINERELVDSLRGTLNQVLMGKSDVVEMLMACLLARGHLLFDDLPGLGKTTLAKALANAVGGHFARVQCTPDLLPTDITGFNIFNQQTREFEFVQGPVFSHVLLADEINRATPRTQSALFEAMAERQVTTDNVSRLLPATFFVIATQNPVESHGAYPLPEAQLDRFAMRLEIGYPDRVSELKMLANNIGTAEIERTKTVVFDPSNLAQLQKSVAAIPVHPKIQGYLVDLARATREHPEVTLGISPRGLLTWQRVSQAWAYLQHREFVMPDDVQAVAIPVIEVRLGVDSEIRRRVIQEILERIPVPVEK